MQRHEALRTRQQEDSFDRSSLLPNSPSPGIPGAISIYHEITFTPLENGLDFCLRALEYLADDPTKRDLKYAVLHLHSGIELILKDVFENKHWSLVFDKPEEASKEKYELGEFISVPSKLALADFTVFAMLKLTNPSGEYLKN